MREQKQIETGSSALPAARGIGRKCEASISVVWDGVGISVPELVARELRLKANQPVTLTEAQQIIAKNLEYGYTVSRGGRTNANQA